MRLRRPRYDVPEAVRRQLRRRRWARWGLFAALLLLASSVVLGRAGCYRGDDWARFDKRSVVVSEVVDGDTVRIRVDQARSDETVRLLGIDAPEADAHWATQAASELRRLLERKSLTLRLDATQTRDDRGRLLAYLYARDADNLNLALVRDGHAYADRLHPHAMIRQFEQAEDEARAKRRGLWADLAEDQMPDWRRRWLADRRAGNARQR